MRYRVSFTLEKYTLIYLIKKFKIYKTKVNL